MKSLLLSLLVVSTTVGCFGQIAQDTDGTGGAVSTVAPPPATNVDAPIAGEWSTVLQSRAWKLVETCGKSPRVDQTLTYRFRADGTVVAYRPHSPSSPADGCMRGTYTVQGDRVIVDPVKLVTHQMVFPDGDKSWGVLSIQSPTRLGISYSSVMCDKTYFAGTAEEPPCDGPSAK